MPSQVTVYVLFSQSTAAPAGTCAGEVRSAEAHPASKRQARTRAVRPRITPAPKPLRDMDIGDHTARDAQDGRVSVATRESHRLCLLCADGAARRPRRASRCTAGPGDCGR